MKQLPGFTFLLLLILLCGCGETVRLPTQSLLVGKGKMPAVATDSHGNPCIVFGTGDSILFCSSEDQGKTFSRPALLALLPGLNASAMRGPQLTFAGEVAVVLACNKAGNIFSFSKTMAGQWSPAVKVNDTDTTAKEGFLAAGHAGNLVFATWLDLRNNQKNKLAAASSTDGGRSWSVNSIVYASPDSTICECCKPSVATKGNDIYVMFRNWLHGNRDMYLLHSTDGGQHFGKAEKLGNEQWPLAGCPMDGGDVIVDSAGQAQTIWRRKNIIYTAQPGHAETFLDSSGKNPTLAAMNTGIAYAWVENGNIIVRRPQGIKTDLGKGQLPRLQRLGNNSLLCVWENNNQVYAAVLPV